MRKYLLLLLSLFIFQFVAFAKYNYTLRWDKPNTHTYWIEIETEPQTESTTEFRIATWRPGRYIAQDYAAAVGSFAVTDEKGNALKYVKTNKNTWRVNHGNITKIKVKYSYFANNEDAGSSFYTEGQVYFNPINCFMYIPERLEDEVTLNVPDLPKDWSIATPLTLTRDIRIYTASSFHEFADSPTVFAKKMKKLTFKVGDVNFFAHFQGDYKGGADVDSAIISGLKKVVAEQGAVFGGFPFKSFHFIYRLLDFDMRHAVEHANSTSVALPSKVTQSVNNVTGGIISISAHEFWHVWNVKRIRPAGLFPYSYDSEQYTGLHWFTEGVTDYYSVLSMARSGVIPESEGLRILGNNMQSIDNSYAYTQVSPVYSSFDSWLGPSTYANPFLRNSFYTLGQRLGLLMDVRLRVITGGKKSMDDVFRYLYENYYEKDLGVPEEGIETALEAISGISWHDFFEKHVRGTQPVNYTDIFKGSGLELISKSNTTATLEKIGILQYERSEDGWFVKKINPAGEAFQAGIGLNDLITRINDKKPSEITDETFFKNLKKGDKITFEYINALSIQHTETVTFSGKAAPVIYTLQRVEKPTAEESAILSGLFGSKAK
ncbi:MAG: hypothetical protein K1X92_15800 [Bacteroidia bacterium]|nr:hypothetical protein [Bacteroidia bacterium]